MKTNVTAVVIHCSTYLGIPPSLGH